MSQVSLPNTISPGQDMDANALMADLNAIAAVVNGLLEAGVNIMAGVAAAALDGNTQAVGVSTNVARADHTHLVRGVERLAADPSTGNFVGRLYFSTVLNVYRLCTNAAGAGTFVTVGPYDATNMPAHASRHALGGADPLTIALGHLPSMPYVHANRTADMTGIATGVETAVNFTAEQADTDTTGGGMHDNATNPSRVTFQTAGVYLVVGKFALSASTVGQTRQGRLRVTLAGGGSRYIGEDRVPVGASGATLGGSIVGLHKAAAGDYVELTVQQDSGGNLQVNWVDVDNPSLKAQWLASGN